MLVDETEGEDSGVCQKAQSLPDAEEASSRWLRNGLLLRSLMNFLKRPKNSFSSILLILIMSDRPVH